MEYKPDANYPKDLLCPTHGTKLKFKRVKFESLLAACCVGFKGISFDNWSKNVRIIFKNKRSAYGYHQNDCALWFVTKIFTTPLKMEPVIYPQNK